MKYDLMTELSNHFAPEAARNIYEVLKNVVKKPGALSFSDDGLSVDVKCPDFKGSLYLRKGNNIAGYLTGENCMIGIGGVKSFIRVVENNEIIEYLAVRIFNDKLKENEDVVGFLNYFDSETFDYFTNKEQIDPTYCDAPLVDVLAEDGIVPDVSINDESIVNDGRHVNSKIYEVIGNKIDGYKNFANIVKNNMEQKGPSL